LAEERHENLPAPRADRRILTREPLNAEAAEGAFAHLVTPAEMRFARCHFEVPLLGDEHRLDLAGAFANPLRISMPELRAMPSAMLTVLTECAGNSRSSFPPPPVEGEPWHDGAISTAQWTGVPLPALLERAGLAERAIELVFTGADGGEYQRSLPREVALDPATLLAFEMNGAPIPPQFGGPLRLVVPDWYGMASVKWLARIEAVETPFSGKFQTEKYVYAPGVPVTRVRVKSMFTSVPELRAGTAARLVGLAWGGEGLARVEVGNGPVWHEARLVGPSLPHAWRRFELHFTPRVKGPSVLRCRAIDARGETQPDRPQRNKGGYGANGVQKVTVMVR
jgi:DMSO/TMAO reductase YedYZ molybdopterin-dependent catalytic subunit